MYCTTGHMYYRGVVDLHFIILIIICTTGHTYSWAFGYPHLLTQCYEHRRKVAGYYGPLNPVRNTTFDFIRKLFSEVFDVFPDRFVHLGGDEVPLECW